MAGAILFASCSGAPASVSSTDADFSTLEVSTDTQSPSLDIQQDKTEENEEESMDIKFSFAKNYKTAGHSNPVMTQAFGADPYALVYGDTVYIYMTADAFEYDNKGEIAENTYSKIKTIHVISTKDFKNFEDHGEIPVAGKNGIAKWANNSWAPAAAVKNIDGKDKFFLYFADNGGGIGVLSADSPVGPFEDPLGKALISRSTPTCDKVLWLFDPAVLVDDDGNGYIYFGGGVPEGMSAEPGTGRVAKLTDDMIEIDGTPVALDVPCLFEDSGIHKYNNRYYYTYCTNWSVPEESAKKYGFTNGQIACLSSDSPMGPFKYETMFLENPGTLCGLYGNNHHAVFSFKDKYYVVYHSRNLEKKMGVQHNYRATYINEVEMSESGAPLKVKQSNIGPEQLVALNPYVETPATLVNSMAGTNATAADSLGYGKMVLSEIETGDYTVIAGVDFGDEGATEITFDAKLPSGSSANIYVKTGDLQSPVIAKVVMNATGDYASYKASFTEPVKGINNLFFLFEGEGFEVKSWICK